MVVPIISSQLSDAAQEALGGDSVRIEVDRGFLWTSEAMSPEARTRKVEREHRMITELNILPAKERKRLALLASQTDPGSGT
jgi:metal-sulfur cluster biosynthetic enzyme